MRSCESIQSQPRAGSTLERVIAFSLPLLKHIDEHRRAAGPKMKREGRVIMHEHMQDVLTSLIADELAMISPRQVERADSDPSPCTTCGSGICARVELVGGERLGAHAGGG